MCSVGTHLIGSFASQGAHSETCESEVAHMWTSSRAGKITLAISLLLIVSIGISLAYNQLLFTFGPWADVWVVEVAVALFVPLMIGAIMIREWWLNPNQTRRAAPPISRAMCLLSVSAIAISGGFISSLALNMVWFHLLPPNAVQADSTWPDLWIEVVWIVCSLTIAVLVLVVRFIRRIRAERRFSGSPIRSADLR